MRRHNGCLFFQKMPDCSFHLRLGGTTVSGENAFDFPCRNFYGRNPTPSACNKYGTANLSKGNTCFGILLQRKDAFNDHEIGFFGIKNGAKLGENKIKAVGQGIVLRGSDRSKGIRSYSGTGSLHDSEPGISQAGIYADCLD